MDPPQIEVELGMIRREELGRGAFAIVYKGKHPTAGDVAVKKISLEWMEPNTSREKENQRNLDHENVLKLIDVKSDGINEYID